MSAEQMGEEGVDCDLNCTQSNPPPSVRNDGALSNVRQKPTKGGGESAPSA